jgi:hypothetical protein
MVHGAWCMVHGAWCMVHDAWCMVHGAWCMVHGAWYNLQLCLFHNVVVHTVPHQQVHKHNVCRVYECNVLTERNVDGIWDDCMDG